MSICNAYNQATPLGRQYEMFATVAHYAPYLTTCQALSTYSGQGTIITYPLNLGVHYLLPNLVKLTVPVNILLQAKKGSTMRIVSVEPILFYPISISLGSNWNGNGATFAVLTQWKSKCAGLKHTLLSCGTTADVTSNAVVRTEVNHLSP